MRKPRNKNLERLAREQRLKREGALKSAWKKADEERDRRETKEKSDES